MLTAIKIDYDEIKGKKFIEIIGHLIKTRHKQSLADCSAEEIAELRATYYEENHPADDDIRQLLSAWYRRKQKDKLAGLDNAVEAVISAHIDPFIEFSFRNFERYEISREIQDSIKN